MDIRVPGFGPYSSFVRINYRNDIEFYAHIGVYLLFFVVCLAATIWMIRTLRNGVLAGFLSCTAIGLLAGTKYECMTARYRCGDMLYSPYFPWETGMAIAAALLAWWLVSKTIGVKAAVSGLWTKPLAGLWLVVFWKVLPAPFIHVPRYGGSCPNIPLLCHDIPLFGFGELLWMSLPFIGWTLWDMYRWRQSR